MPVHVSGFKEQIKDVRNLQKKIVSSEILNKLALFFMAEIKTRTLKGYDVDGSAFAEYSPKYAFVRQEKGLPTYIVDLFFTGSMMSAMTYKVNKKGIHLFFQDTVDKNNVRNPEKAFYLNKKRKFLKLNADEINEAGQMYENYLKEVF